MVIMIGSQQVKDKLQYELYLKLTQGRLSPNQMIGPLARILFFDYFYHLSRLMRKYSTQNRKTGTFLMFISIIQCKFNDSLPASIKALKSIPDVGNKKAVATLKICGLYNRVGIGPGAGTHVIKCFSHILLDEGVESVSGGKVVQMRKFIPAHPGLDTK